MRPRTSSTHKSTARLPGWTRLAALSLWYALVFTVKGAQPLYLSEILFNPPGPDVPNEYVELRGPANLIIAEGTYLVTIEGDAAGNPGTVEDVFDLSSLSVGGNGYLLLLQKGNDYVISSKATVRTYSGARELKNPSVTYMLIQTTNPPTSGLDIDSDNNGKMDGVALADWTVLDSIGVLDADGTGDIAYGKFNFRRNTPPGNAASASGRIYGLPFTPRYVARQGNTTGSTEEDWAAGDALTGVAPDWVLGDRTNTWPPALAQTRLDHLGGPNFGAPELPGVVLAESGDKTEVSKSGDEDSYTLSLNTEPAGPVSIRATCEPPLQVSADNGTNWSSEAILVLTHTAPGTVRVRAVENGVLDTAWRMVAHAVVSTADERQYPTNSLIPDVRARVKEFLLLNELRVNPPGADGGYEYIELRGTPGALIRNAFLVELEGDSTMNPGTVTYVRSLDGLRVGTNGLVVVIASPAFYDLPPGTAVISEPLFGGPEGGLSNGATSFLLVSATGTLDSDLDKDDDGKLESLPPDSDILDAVGWTDGGKNGIVYGGAQLKGASWTPDAACRWPSDVSSASASAWFFGDLAGTNAASVQFDPAAVNKDFPPGTQLTPGAPNRVAPTIVSVQPAAISGVIGDRTNPGVEVTLGAEADPSLLSLLVASTNWNVLPPTNIYLATNVGSRLWLQMEPTGVGYSEVKVTVSDSYMSNTVSFAYAASEPGRPGGTWHLGACDGSTAIPLAPDWMLVGDDENQVIRLYERGASGVPRRQFDFTSDLQLPDAESGFPREVDIEASTQTGNHLFWIGSHGHSALGETRTNRTRLFATELVGTGADTTLRYLGRYDYLKLDLVNWDERNLHGRGTNYYGLAASDAEGVPPKAPDGSGFAIEGLAMMPGETNGAYLAFRAPIVAPASRTFALVLPVLNFAALAVNGGPPGSALFGQAIELDLYGRGIRSIERCTNIYVIVGGPPGPAIGPYPQDFRLYTWSGNPMDRAEERACDLSGLNPEGIIEFRPGVGSRAEEAQANLLSDMGTRVFYGDGIPAKALKVRNFKKCRSDWVAVGPVVLPVPLITEASMSSSRLAIRWRSLKGVTYQLWAADEPNGVWAALDGAVIASGPYAEARVTAAQRQRFYRVVAQSP